MLHSFFSGLLGAVAIAFLFFAAGCGEDPRFSAKTQYLGGVYGGAPGGPSRDTVSYWDGDYVDSAGNVVVPNVDVTKDPKPPGTHFRGTPMPYFMRIVSGTGLHAGYLPGYPASHGCIRMPEFMAENFFKSVSLGTPVTIAN